MRVAALALGMTLAASLASPGAAPARAGADIGDDPAGLSGFPRDAASLRQLDGVQLRVVRRARSQCWHAGPGVVERACIINATEAALAARKDEILKAYSDALPLNARYDPYRPALYWQRLVIRPPQPPK